MTEKIVLLGLMGAGKSTVGAALAQRLGWPWRDSDRDIEASTGQTVRALKDSLGVDEMHELEAEQLLEALSEPGPSVISAAASVIDVEGCRAALGAPGVVCVWLKLAPATLAGRFASDGHRPSYGDDPAAFLEAQLVARAKWFRSVARLEVDTDGLAPSAIVDAIVERAALTDVPPTP